MISTIRRAIAFVTAVLGILFLDAAVYAAGGTTYLNYAKTRIPAFLAALGHEYWSENER